MASKTVFVVQAFELHRKRLVPTTKEEARNEERARHVAERVAGRKAGAAVLAGHESDPGPSALALRLMAAVHRLVLTGAAPGLAAHYPSVGGTGDPDAAWPAFRQVLIEHVAEVRAGLASPPQTNEVGRSAALFGGLLQLASDGLPVRLFEIGSSGGLNLLADFQPDIVKIDMALIRGIDRDRARQTIVGALAAVGQLLGIRVIAEGVEEAREALVLRHLGITLMQGYLFATPAFEALPPVDFDALDRLLDAA